MAMDETQLAVLATKVDRVGVDIKEIKDGLAQSYATKSELAPIKEKVDSIQRGFFWLIGIIVLALVTAFFRVIGVIK